MQVYTFSEARQKLASILEQASKDGEVRIKRRDGRSYILKPDTSAKSPLDVKGVDIGISASEIVDFIREGRERRGGGFDFTRFYINVGKNKNLNPAGLMKIINENSKFQNVEIGSIDILKNFSFFEFDKNHEKELIEAFKNVEFEGTKLILEPTKKDKRSARFRPKKRSSDYPRHAKFNSRPDQKRRNKRY